MDAVHLSCPPQPAALNTGGATADLEGEDKFHYTNLRFNGEKKRKEEGTRYNAAAPIGRRKARRRRERA